MEFWVDTKWEPYKEGIQQDIRRQLTTDGKDLAEWDEFTIDLDEGDEEWIYTAHCSKIDRCPPKKKILFTKWSHFWICVHQSHKTKRKIRLIPLPVERAHMEEEGFHEVD